ncbi:MAG: GNAT family N-acetyltransferase [Oscillospiraceae bacterium]|nr:GNAT family N-acetyltransferase [Oscillospiraceae bacterium]
MEHCGTVRLESERLILRRFTPEDARAMYDNWASDPEVTAFLTWAPHESPAATRRLLEQWAASYSDERYYQWAIVWKENGDEPIGSISAVGIKDSISAIEIGYCIGRRWWHRGITSEALATLIDFFFDRVGANRIECRHDPNNPRSGMVMKKCGLRYEGTSRSADRNNQGICDVCRYAILRQDRS